LFQFFWFT